MVIFRAVSAALNRGRCLFEGGVYLSIIQIDFFHLFLFNGALSMC